jgi:hypothetical protein
MNVDDEQRRPETYQQITSFVPPIAPAAAQRYEEGTKKQNYKSQKTEVSGFRECEPINIVNNGRSAGQAISALGVAKRIISQAKVVRSDSHREIRKHASRRRH